MDREDVDRIVRRFEDKIFIGVEPSAEEREIFGIAGGENVNPNRGPAVTRSDVILGLYQAMVKQKRATHSDLMDMIETDSIDQTIHDTFKNEPTYYYTMFYCSKTIVGPVNKTTDVGCYREQIREKYYGRR